ncbi:MAG: phage head-tail connector protein [Pseudomonadota bacterium]|nr:phage head-tail connector protein [Pseudomonadota bacterium]
MTPDHITLITAPSEEPLTLEQVKTDRGGINHSEHDDLLTQLIAAARERAENATGRALMPQVWQQLHTKATAELDLIRWPVGDLVSVTIDGEEQDIAALVASGDLELWKGDQALLISPLFYGKRVIVQYNAGYADAAAVPSPLKKWMLMQIGAMYEHRESEVVGVATNKLKYVDSLIQPYRVR